jgi:purine-binding chemotaxis protein CheW
MAQSARAGSGGTRLPMATVDNYLHGYSRRGRSEAWSHELLGFQLGGESYAVNLLSVREIVTRRPITEVPRTPAFLPGIISLRGLIVPVLDLRLRLGLPASTPTRASRVLIVQQASSGESFGLSVDAVRQVIRLSDEEIETRPPAFAGRESEFIAAIGRPRSGGMLIVLALDAVLSFQMRRAEPRGGR